MKELIDWAVALVATLVTISKSLVEIQSWRDEISEEGITEMPTPLSASDAFLVDGDIPREVVHGHFKQAVRSLFVWSSPFLKLPLGIAYIVGSDTVTYRTNMVSYHAIVFQWEKGHRFPFPILALVSLISSYSQANPDDTFDNLYLLKCPERIDDRGIHSFMAGLGSISQAKPSFPPLTSYKLVREIAALPQKISTKGVVGSDSPAEESAIFEAKEIATKGVDVKLLDSMVLKRETRRYVVENLSRFVDYRHLDDLKNSQQPRRIGLIFHGPKGTGKSEIARSLSPDRSDIFKIHCQNITELVYCIRYISQSYLKPKNDTQSEEVEGHVRDKEILIRGYKQYAYEAARRLNFKGTIEEFVRDFPNARHIDVPSVIIIDDFDRIDFSDTRMIPQLLSEIDSLGYSKPVILIATTNDYHNIPDVIRRAGRFSINAKFSLFDQEMIDQYLEKMWGAISEKQHATLSELLKDQPPAWPLSLVTKSMSVDDAIDVLIEARDQQWIFDMDDSQSFAECVDSDSEYYEDDY